MERNHKKVNVLIIAGGGPFGLIASYFMRSTGLVTLTGLVDVLGGTSVGSELICAYACDNPPAVVHSKFAEAVLKIFKQSWFPKIRGAKYDTKVLQEVLKDIIDKDFGDFAIPTIVPILDFENNKFKVYDNIVKDKDCEQAGYVMSTQSSSAPTYFVPFRGGIDGGIVENIPIMTTLTAIKDKMGVNFSDMNVLAIGTGQRVFEKRDMKKVAKWYFWKWLSPMLEELTDANEKASVFWAKRLGLNYFEYYNPVVLDKEWKMGKPQLYVDDIQERCEQYVKDFNRVFSEFVNA